MQYTILRVLQEVCYCLHSVGYKISQIMQIIRSLALLLHFNYHVPAACSVCSSSSICSGNEKFHKNIFLKNMSVNFSLIIIIEKVGLIVLRFQGLRVTDMSV